MHVKHAQAGRRTETSAHRTLGLGPPQEGRLHGSLLVRHLRAPEGVPELRAFLTNDQAIIESTSTTCVLYILLYTHTKGYSKWWNGPSVPEPGAIADHCAALRPLPGARVGPGYELRRRAHAVADVRHRRTSQRPLAVAAHAACAIADHSSSRYTALLHSYSNTCQCTVLLFTL